MTTPSSLNIHVDGIIFSLQSHGGISVYWLELLGRLATRIKLQLEIYQKLQHTIKWKNSGIVRQTQARLLERVRDVPVESSYTLFHSTYYRLPRRPTAARIVTTIHDFTPEIYGTGFRSWAHSIQKRRAIMASDGLICISKSTYSDLKQRLSPIKAKSISVIYNGVSDDFYPGENYNEQGNHAVFVGQRSGYKNFSAAVQALEGTGYTLSIIGGGPLSPHETSLLNKKLSGGWVHHVRVDQPQLREILWSAAILIYPSIYEGFGLPVLEAMATGLPVVAVHTSSIPEVAGDAAIYAEDGSASSLHEAVLRSRDASLRLNMRERGLIRAAEFSWDKTAKEMIDFYSSLSI